ncbi:MAG: protein kinase [Ruminococcus sp.]|nr:protein kinase [Ruminococcus sp.]
MYCYNCMRKLEGDTCPQCHNFQKISHAPHYLVPGTMLRDRYLVGNTLGEGGFGITYMGLDTTLDIRVAIKEFYPSGYANRNTQVSSQITVQTERQKAVFDKGKQRFVGEARSIAKFNKEPGTVDVRDYFEENGTAYIIMEYLEGQELGRYVRSKGKMRAEDLFRIMLPIMHSLEKMHSKGIIHRDISPDNIMYQTDGTLKLMDFGSARYYTNEEKELSVMIKKGYAPEEQYHKNGDQGPWTDVYGLCATIYRCITGTAPVDSLDRFHDDTLIKPSVAGADISPDLEKVLLYGLAVSKDLRCQSMSELMDLTLKALEGEDATPVSQRKPDSDEDNKTVAVEGMYKDQPSAKAVITPREAASTEMDLSVAAKSAAQPTTPVNSYQQQAQPPAQVYQPPVQAYQAPAPVQNYQPAAVAYPARIPSRQDYVDNYSGQNKNKKKKKSSTAGILIIISIVVVLIVSAVLIFFISDSMGSLEDMFSSSSKSDRDDDDEEETTEETRNEVINQGGLVISTGGEEEEETIPVTETEVVEDEPSISDSRQVCTAFSTVTASSTLSDQYGRNYSPENVLINDGHCWAENVAGVGENEWIKLSADSEQYIDGIVIVNGYSGTDEQYNDNGKVSSVKIKFSNGSYVEADVAVYSSDEKHTIQYFDFNQSVLTSSVEVIITGAVQGDFYSDTCITYLVPYVIN